MISAKECPICKEKVYKLQAQRTREEKLKHQNNNILTDYYFCVNCQRAFKLIQKWELQEQDK